MQNKIKDLLLENENLQDMLQENEGSQKKKTSEDNSIIEKARSVSTEEN